MGMALYILECVNQIGILCWTRTRRVYSFIPSLTGCFERLGNKRRQAKVSHKRSKNQMMLTYLRKAVLQAIHILECLHQIQK